MSAVLGQRTLAGYRIRGQSGERYVWNFEMVVRGGRSDVPHDVRHWRAHFAEKTIAILFPPTDMGRAAAHAINRMLDDATVVRVMRRT